MPRGPALAEPPDVTLGEIRLLAWPPLCVSAVLARIRDSGGAGPGEGGEAGGGGCGVGGGPGAGWARWSHHRTRPLVHTVSPAATETRAYWSQAAV
jgi:hypothetical protein